MRARMCSDEQIKIYKILSFRLIIYVYIELDCSTNYKLLNYLTSNANLIIYTVKYNAIKNFNIAKAICGSYNLYHLLH